MTSNEPQEILSVVVPVYNEQEVIGEFHTRTMAVLDTLGMPVEIIYVNDGSRDGTLALLLDLAANDPRVAVMDLSRNFGKEIAMSAGLDAAVGDAVIVIDADLQDPPELIPRLIEEWRNGFDVVYAKRKVRHGESLLKRATARAFYKVMGQVSRIEIPANAGDYRLLSRRAVEALRSVREHHRFMKGLFAWIGFPQKAVEYERDPRFAGRTKWNYWRLWNFALEGITSFTTAPLRIASYLGLIVAFIGLLYAVFIIYKTLVFGETVRGFPTLMVIILCLGGLQLAFLGIIGEYLGRMFDEVKQRPLYLVNRYQPSAIAQSRQDAGPAKQPDVPRQQTFWRN
jgi:polyisoprenyl-phosphate glycosyltransferase